MIAFDSDGCVLNAMEPKHRYCFGPAAVEIYGLEAIKDAFLAEWNRVNLYAPTRGINRFVGLAEVFENLRRAGDALPAQEALRDWCNTTPALSEELLEKDSRQIPSLGKALEWSRRVNGLTKEIGEKIVPFPGAPEAVRAAAENCLVAVVSSAREEQIRGEWRKFGMADCVTRFCGQERGTKTQCLAKLKRILARTFSWWATRWAIWTRRSKTDLRFIPFNPARKRRPGRRFARSTCRRSQMEPTLWTMKTCSTFYNL